MLKKYQYWNRFVFKMVILIVMGIILFDLKAQDSQFQWARAAGGSDYDAGYGVATDRAGHVYVTGYFTESISFGDEHQLNAYGGKDIFIAKYDSSGNLCWVKKAGGSDYDIGFGIAVADPENIYITGAFSDVAYFDEEQVITGYGQSDIFIARYDSSGGLIWVQKAGGSDRDNGEAVAVTANGNICVTGTCGDSVTFGEYYFTNGFGGRDIFIAKYDTLGNVLWVQLAGGKGDDNGAGLAGDDSENIFLVGTFADSAFFGNNNLYGNGFYDIFISKYDALGNLKWVTNTGGEYSDMGNDIDVDGFGNLYITGYTQPSAIVDYRIFIAKFDTLGSPVWSQNVGGTGYDIGKGVTLDDCGNVYVTGSFESPASFGDGIEYTGKGQWDIFVVKYNPSGNVLWVQTAGGSEGDFGKKIVKDDYGRTYVTGSFIQSASFDSHDITGFGNYDMFITVIQEPFIQVISPNGGEVWKPDSSYDIIWDSGGAGTDVQITLRADSSWQVIEESTPNDGVYQWMIPDFVKSSKCRIKICDAGNPGLCDLSNESFVITDSLTTIENKGNQGIPSSYSLRQNYPNPFNSGTVIRFDVKKRTRVVLKVYDTLGKEVLTLADKVYDSGRYELLLQNGRLPSGLYFCRIRMDDYTAVKKMII
ncbi:MAG: SBBP repeat-containing protein, partial [bacterium]